MDGELAVRAVKKDCTCLHGDIGRENVREVVAQILKLLIKVTVET